LARSFVAYGPAFFRYPLAGGRRGFPVFNLYAGTLASTLPMLKATLEIVLFLLSGIAMAAAKVAALAALGLAVPVAGVLLWRRLRK